MKRIIIEYKNGQTTFKHEGLNTYEIIGILKYYLDFIEVENKNNIKKELI
jgi:hypothetical protein